MIGAGGLLPAAAEAHDIALALLEGKQRGSASLDEFSVDPKRHDDAHLAVDREFRAVLSDGDIGQHAIQPRHLLTHGISPDLRDTLQHGLAAPSTLFRSLNPANHNKFTPFWQLSPPVTDGS